MKVKLFILFFVLCAFCTSASAQQYPDCPEGWVEVILVFPPEISSAEILTLKTELSAFEVDYIRIINARLWRICKGFTPTINGVTYPAMNSPSEVIGVIGDGHQSMRTRVGASPNDSTKIKIIDSELSIKISLLYVPIYKFARNLQSKSLFLIRVIVKEIAVLEHLRLTII
jgi:hypothetical protein